MDPRQPPQDIAAEQAVLGCLLVDSQFEYTAIVVGILKATDFFRVDHRAIYEVVADFFRDKKPMDLIVMEDELRKRKSLEDAGGRDYLIELARSVGSIAHAEHYANIVREKSRLRQQIADMHRILAMAYEPDADPVKLQEKVSALSSERAIEAQTTSETAEVITIDLIEELDHEAPSGGIQLGLPGIDDEVMLMPGDMAIIAARPGVGKSSLTLQVCLALAWSGLRIGLLSLEMKRALIGRRIIQHYTGVSAKRQATRDMTAEELAAVRNVRSPRTLHIDDSFGITVDQARAKATAMKHRFGIDLFVIDYVQLLRGGASRYSNKAAEVSDVSGGVKAIASALNIPVIAVAQFNRENDKQGRRPQLSDLKDSGSLEQDASVVIAIHYPDPTDRGLVIEAKLDVLKNRNDSCNLWGYEFDRRFVRFNRRPPKEPTIEETEPDNQPTFDYGEA